MQEHIKLHKKHTNLYNEIVEQNEPDLYWHNYIFWLVPVALLVYLTFIGIELVQIMSTLVDTGGDN